MSRTAKELLDDAIVALQDNEPGYEYSRWTKAELLSCVTQAMAALHFFKPELYNTKQVLTLLPGAVQRIGPEFSKLIELDSNLAPDGTEGSPITESSEPLLKAFNRPLPFDPMQPYKVVTYRMDTTNPRVFYVNPPAPESPRHKVVAALVQTPPTVLDENQELVLPASDSGGWYNVLLDYMLFRAFQKDTESATSRTKARDHEIAFMQAVGANARLDRLQEGADE